MAEVITWINKTSLAHHAMTDLKFESYTVLSTSSPMIEASKLVLVEVESIQSCISDCQTLSVDGDAGNDVACTILMDPGFLKGG